MFPLGHVAVAYLCFVAYATVARRPLTLSWGLVPLVIGSQLPDLIDKPLAFYGLLPSGRSLGHSLGMALLCIGLVTWGIDVVVATDRTPWGRRLAARTPPLFAIGYLSHLGGDILTTVLAGQYGELTFVVWPLLPAPQYPVDRVSPLVRVHQTYQQPTGRLSLALIVTAGLLWCLLQVWAALSTDR